MSRAIVIHSLIDTLPFHQALTWEKFQSLCTDVLYKTANSVDAREYLLKGSSQQGIDVYAIPREGKKVTVAQCKLKDYISPQQVINIVDEFLKGNLVKDTTEFILCTSADLGRQRDEEQTIEVARGKLAAHGIKFIVWDERGLSKELRTDSLALINIVYRYFGEQVAAAFYGDIWKDYIKRFKKVQKHKYPLQENHIERSIVSYQDRITKGENDTWFFWSSQKKPSLAALIEQEIGNKGKKIILLSSAGFGKTEELRYLAGYFSEDDKLLYPIKFYLRDYDGQSIEDILINYDPDWRNISSENILFIFDGLDEISEHHSRSFINRLNAFIELHPDCSAVISSRYNFYNVRSDELRGFEIYLLNPLTFYDIERYLNEKLGQKKADFKDLLEEKYFNDYINNPYYLTRLVRFYTENAATFPKNKSELFEKLLFEKIEKDQDRYHVSELKAQLLPIAKQIAFCMTLAGKSSLTDDELRVLVLDHEVRKNLNHFSIFNRNSESIGTWSFEHKNLQEYLCASVFINRDFAEVHTIISFEHDVNKLLPRFLNTVSFLFELLDKNGPLFFDLFNWINANEPELLVRFEKEQLSRETRRKIFEKIFYHYKDKGITLRISPHLSNNELANFVEVDNWVIDFLGKELQTVLPAGLAYDAINIIATHKRPFLAQNKIEQVLFSVLNSTSYNSFVKGQAIEAFADTRLASRQVFECILASPADLNDFEVRRACITLLNTVDYAEDYVDFVLTSIPVFEAGQKEMSYAGSNEMIKRLLLGFNKPQSVKKIFQYCIIDDNVISQHSHYREFQFELEEVKKLLTKAIEMYETDRSILRVVYRLFCGLEYIAFWDEWFQEFRNFFQQTCGTKIVFHKFYHYGKKDREIMSFADAESCDFLIDEYQKGHIQDQQMTYYQNVLSWVDYNLFKSLNKKLNEVTENRFVYENLDVNFNEIDRLQEQKNQQLLLDKQLFLQEADVIFGMIAKDKISYRDLCMLSHKDLRRYRT
ncbi:MAG: hypothetical protein ICV66_07410, partial [Chitinophagaceae bacterium]|nr:hypothetical protein [Chitinophagaceae bacterium]